MIPLEHDGIEALPLIHGRLAFAIEARRRLLESRYAAIAIELPAGVRAGVLEAVELLPVASVVLYRELGSELGASRGAGAPADAWYYIPVQPADGIIEACRVAARERTPVEFVDADLGDFEPRFSVLPDPNALHTLGLERYFDACLPHLERLRPTAQDRAREEFMAARLAELRRRYAGRILFLCGMAHWRGVLGRLRESSRAGGLGSPAAPGAAPDLEVRVLPAAPRSIPFLMGEIPAIVERYEEHRSGLELEPFSAARALERLLIECRALHSERFPESFESTDPHTLRTLVSFTRRMTVRGGGLLPDSYTLVVAANGVAGNDYALTLLERAHRYRFNLGGEEEDDSDGLDPVAGEDESTSPLQMDAERALIGGEPVRLIHRAPGTAFTYGRLRLDRRPDPRRSRRWQTVWDHGEQCSHEPEDLVIENFRDYVGRRALSLAQVDTTRTHPFTTSLLDGIDLRATLRDVVQRRLHVREERRVAGGIGALVVIFEEDDFGERYPWRTTWYAEHEKESTLSFYATDFLEDLIAPGIGRAHYGGIFMLFPPLRIPDLWSDLRFENARTPSERLLLAAIYWAEDHFVVHVGRRPPAPAVAAEAARRRKHLLHLPLSTFSPRTLARLRRVHVLNGKRVRTWAHRFIR